MSADEQVALAVQLTYLNEKLDAIHLSLKEDLGEIKAETKETNGRVSRHDREIAKLTGGVMAIAAGLPVITGLLVFSLQQLI